MRLFSNRIFSNRFSRRAGLALVLPLTLGLASVAHAHPPGGECGGECSGECTGPEAKHAPTPKQQSCRAQFRAEKLKKFDTDKDGKMSPQERRAARAAHKAEALAKYDKDKDGKLSKSERADMLHDRVTEKFESIDTNSDAEISSSEAQNSCSPLGRHFDRVDEDGNGSITWTEFEKKAKARMKRGMRARHGKFRRGQGRPGGVGPI
jgi:Ca2+-binding EF-hand superfamily protein